MSRDPAAEWAKFDGLGEGEVRKQLGGSAWGEERKNAARAWLAHRDALSEDASRETTLALAREANALARSANDAALEANSIARSAADSASVSAAAARTNNTIATLALIAAVIAMALSIIAMFIGK